jgi:hypothetical protein
MTDDYAVCWITTLHTQCTARNTDYTKFGWTTLIGTRTGLTAHKLFSYESGDRTARDDHAAVVAYLKVVLRKMTNKCWSWQPALLSRKHSRFSARFQRSI